MLEYFQILLNIFEISLVWGIVESWLVYTQASFHESSNRISWLGK